MGLLDEAIREHLDLKRRRGADPAEIEKAEREALGPVRRDRAAVAAGYEDAGDAPAALADRPQYDEPAGFDEPTAVDPPTAYDEPVAPVDEAIDFETVEPTPAAPQPTAHAEQLVEERRTPKRRSLLHRRHRDADETTPVEDVDAERSEPASSSVADEFHLPRDEAIFAGEHESYEHVHSDFDEPEDDYGVEPAMPESDQGHEPPAAPPVQRYEPPAPQPAPPAPPTPEPVAPDDPILGETVEYDVERALREDDDEDELLEETPEFLQDTPDHDRLWFEQKPPKDFDI